MTRLKIIHACVCPLFSWDNERGDVPLGLRAHAFVGRLPLLLSERVVDTAREDSRLVSGWLGPLLFEGTGSRSALAS